MDALRNNFSPAIQSKNHFTNASEALQNGITTSIGAKMEALFRCGKFLKSLHHFFWRQKNDCFV